MNERKIYLNNKNRDGKIKATHIDAIKISEAKRNHRKPNEVCKPKNKEKKGLNYLHDGNENLLLSKDEIVEKIVDFFNEHFNQDHSKCVKISEEEELDEYCIRLIIVKMRWKRKKEGYSANGKKNVY